MSYMTLKELKKLIKYCREQNIKCIEFDGVKLDFGADFEQKTPKMIKNHVKKSDDISEQTLRKQEIETKRDMVDDLLLSDPLEYERRLGEDLVDEKSQH